MAAITKRAASRKVSFGGLQPQVGSDFTGTSMSGNFTGGSEQPVNTNVGGEADFVNLTFNSSSDTGNVTGTSDNNSECGSGCSGPSSSSIPGTYTVAGTGRVTVSQVENGVTVTAGYLYIISDTAGSGQAVFLQAGSGCGSGNSNGCNPSLTNFHQ